MGISILASSPLSPSSWLARQTLSTVTRLCGALKQFPIWAGLA